MKISALKCRSIGFYGEDFGFPKSVELPVPDRTTPPSHNDEPFFPPRKMVSSEEYRFPFSLALQVNLLLRDASGRRQVTPVMDDKPPIISQGPFSAGPSGEPMRSYPLSQEELSLDHRRFS